MEFPTAGLLDDLAAGGALRPTTLFDSVGYAAIAQFKGGQAQYEAPSGRMFSTSKFLGLTKSHLKLLTSGDADYGGGCFAEQPQRQVTVPARCVLVGPTAVEVRLGPRIVAVDEPHALGGQGTAPTPEQYALAALGACEAITFRYWPERLGIPFDERS